MPSIAADLLNKIKTRRARTDVVGGDVRNVGTSFRNGLDLPAIEIDARRVKSSLGQFDGEGQSDVSQTDDARARAAGLDFIQ